MYFINFVQDYMSKCKGSKADLKYCYAVRYKNSATSLFTIFP